MKPAQKICHFDIILSAIINREIRQKLLFLSIISSELYVIHKFWTRLVPSDASSATSGFCVNAKDVAYGNASFLIIFTVEINDKSTNKFGLCQFLWSNCSKNTLIDARGTLTTKVERKNLFERSLRVISN